MFGSLGAPELFLIAVVCLFLVGTKRLPELGKGVGEGIRNFKKALSEEPTAGDEKKQAE